MQLRLRTRTRTLDTRHPRREATMLARAIVLRPSSNSNSSRSRATRRRCSSSSNKVATTVRTTTLVQRAPAGTTRVRHTTTSRTRGTADGTSSSRHPRHPSTSNRATTTEEVTTTLLSSPTTPSLPLRVMRRRRSTSHIDRLQARRTSPTDRTSPSLARSARRSRLDHPRQVDKAEDLVDFHRQSALDSTDQAVGDLVSLRGHLLRADATPPGLQAVVVEAVLVVALAQAWLVRWVVEVAAAVAVADRPCLRLPFLVSASTRLLVVGDRCVGGWAAAVAR